MTNSNVVNNEARSRLEITKPDGVAFLDYVMRADRLVIVHTEVPDELEGGGLGSALVRAAVDLADERDLALDVRCPFARDWLTRHPDQAARVAQVST
jgi:uncharacterized protein